MNIQAEQLSRVLEKYALSRPVSPGDQRYILRRSRSSLRQLLKARGAYGLSIGFVIATGYLFRKMGIKLTLIQSKIIAGVTAATMTAGSVTGVYKGGEYIKKKMDGPGQAEKLRENAGASEPELRSAAEIQNYYHKLEEINLDDGSRIIGAVVYQDSTVIKVHTVHGIIELPVKSVISIKIK